MSQARSGQVPPSSRPAPTHRPHLRDALHQTMRGLVASADPGLLNGKEPRLNRRRGHLALTLPYYNSIYTRIQYFVRHTFDRPKPWIGKVPGAPHAWQGHLVLPSTKQPKSRELHVWDAGILIEGQAHQASIAIQTLPAGWEVGQVVTIPINQLSEFRDTEDDDVWTFHARLDSAHANVPLTTKWTLQNRWDTPQPITVIFHASPHYEQSRRPRKRSSSLSKRLAAHEPIPRAEHAPPLLLESTVPRPASLRSGTGVDSDSAVPSDTVLHGHLDPSLHFASIDESLQSPLPSSSPASTPRPSRQNRRSIDPTPHTRLRGAPPSYRSSESRRSSYRSAVDSEENFETAQSRNTSSSAQSQVAPDLSSFQTTSAPASLGDTAIGRRKAFEARMEQINEARAEQGRPPLEYPEEDLTLHEREREEQRRRIPPAYRGREPPTLASALVPAMPQPLVPKPKDTAFVQGLVKKDGCHLLQERIKLFLKAQMGGVAQTFRGADAEKENVRFSSPQIIVTAEIPRRDPERAGQYTSTREKVVSIICYLPGLWRAVKVTQEERCGLRGNLSGSRRHAFVLPGEELDMGPELSHLKTVVLVDGVRDLRGHRLYRFRPPPLDEWQFSARTGFHHTDPHGRVLAYETVRTTWTLWMTAEKGSKTKHPVTVHFVRRDPFLAGSREERQGLDLTPFEMGKGARGTRSRHARREGEAEF